MKKINNSLKRSVVINTLCRPISFVVLFIYTPILLHCLGDEAYGIWSTILSITNWINYFDIGIGNGLRNILTVHIEHGESEETTSDVSTAYIVLTFISTIAFFVSSIVVIYIDDHRVFNTMLDVKLALEVSLLFVCINFVLSLCKILLYATNQTEKVGIMTLLIQIINLCGIMLLSFFRKGNLLNVAVVVGASGMMVYACFSIAIWNKYRNLLPSPRLFAKHKLKDICNIGLKFFLIQMAGVVLYTTDNFIIIRLFGPTYVTPYQTAYSLFGSVNALYISFMAPLWARYTIANERKDYIWIRKTISKLSKTMPFAGCVLLLGVFLYKPISVIWLRKELSYDVGLISLMGVYNFILVFGNIYTTACNGMGRINVQLYVSIISAVLNIPLSFYFGVVLHLKTTGVILATVICLLLSIIPEIIDIRLYLRKMERSAEMT